MSVLRSIGSVVAGVFAAGLFTWLIQRLGHTVYPPPEGLISTDRAALTEYVAGLPLGALLFVLGSYGGGTLLGGWVAGRIAADRKLLHAMIVGAIQLLFGVLNVAMIPHPLWFVVVALPLFPIAAWVGGKLAER